MFFRVNEDDKDSIDQAVETMHMGGVVLYKTTSPWGWALSCDATDDSAVRKLMDISLDMPQHQRIVIVQDEQMLEKYITPMPYFIKEYLREQEKYVTVIFPQHGHIAPTACYPDGSIPVRIIPSIDTPPVQMSRHVLRLGGKPILAVACTLPGKTITSYEQITPEIKSAVGHTSPLLFGIDDLGQPSMIIKYDPEGHISVVRK